MFHARTKPDSSAFPATDWAVVLAAGAEDPGAHPATLRICQLYWQPVYSFLRRTWPAKSADEALEATNEFFTLRLEKHDIKNLNREKGLFRNWLRGAATNHLLSARRSSERERLSSLDALPCEQRVGLEPRTTLDPLLMLEHELALGILERAIAKLEREYAPRLDPEFLRAARPLLTPGEIDETYAALELRWGLSSGTLKVRIYTMRRRLGVLICNELDNPPGDEAARQRELAWFTWAIALKEEPWCPKSKALPLKRATPA
jgi:hypothetical protein